MNPNKKLSQYILQSWNADQGFGSESSNDIIQTKEGYIWIATYTGLYRFDGKDFKVFTSQNSAIPSSNVLRIGYDSNNVLWVGTLHGLAKLENGEFVTPEALLSSSNQLVESMTITSDNGIWFGTKSNKLYRFKDNKLEDFTAQFNDQQSTVTCISENNGVIYFGTDDSKITRYSDATGFEEILENRNLNGINQIYFSDKGNYLGTGNGLYLLDENQITKVEAMQNIAITSITEDAFNSLWLGTMNGIYRLREGDNSLDYLDQSKGLPNDIIRVLMVDQENNLWAGTYRNGIFMLSDGSLTSYSNVDGLKSDIISGITQLSENKILFGSENSELSVLENGRISPFDPKIALPTGRLKHLMSDSKGRVWASTYVGLYVIEDSKLNSFNLDSGFPDNFVRVSYEDRNGNVWVGTKNAGLFKFNSLSKWETLDISKGLSSNYIMSITENAQGQLIVGTMHGINFIEGMDVKKIITTEDGLPSNFTFSIYPEDDILWIGSNDGLIRYHPDQVTVFNIHNGLPSNVVYDVLPDASGNLWLPSEKSIIKVNINNLNEAAEDSSVSLMTEEYDQSDGMKNSHCLGATLSLIDDKKNLWVPTIGGVVLVEPDKVKSKTTPPKPILENMMADNSSLSLLESMVNVPAGTDRLRIKFTGISFGNTQRISFRYRLKPFDETWIEDNGTRSALYTNITPGNYEFEIQSGVNNQFTSEVVSKTVNFEASWWQTIWAKLFAIVIIVALVMFLNLYRVSRLKERNQNLEEMVDKRTNELLIQKQELADALKELSDAQEKMLQSEKMASLGVLSAGVAHEINNPLNFIKGGANVLDTLDFEDHKDSSKIRELIGIINEGVNRASGIVSNLNQFSYNKEGVVGDCDINKIISNCYTMLAQQVVDNVDFKIDLSETPTIVIGNSGQLHQVLINLMTNALHAVGSKGEIRVQTRSTKNTVEIEITDDGYGIDPKIISKIMEPFFTTKPPGEGTGLGLSIAYNIITEHEGTINFASAKGQGTKVLITLPKEGVKNIA
ncbi:MAG: hypothetical protein JXR10_15425 [Cyclobacteriaceae bacterium]